MLYTHVPDENFSLYYAPKFKDADFKVSIGSDTTVLVYLQNNLTKFINYLFNNFNIVLYHTSSPEYSTLILNLIDPNKKFKTIYGKENCHIYLNQSNERIEVLRDINLFHDISLKKKIILDSGSISNLCNPDNGKIIKYNL